MEQLYRLVKTSKGNHPPNHDKRIMYVTMIKKGKEIEPAFTPYFNKWETRGKYEVIEWFEPVTQE